MDGDGKFTKGLKSLYEYEQPRRVTVVQPEATNEHTHGVGGQVNPTTGNREPAVLTRAVHFDWHIWDATREGEDDRVEDTEQLLHDLIVAIRTECMGRVRFLGDSWLTQTDAGADFAVAGQYALLRTTIEIPVVRESRALTAVATEGTTITHEGPGGDEVVHQRPPP